MKPETNRRNLRLSNFSGKLQCHNNILAELLFPWGFPIYSLNITYVKAGHLFKYGKLELYPKIQFVEINMVI